MRLTAQWMRTVYQDPHGTDYSGSSQVIEQPHFAEAGKSGLLLSTKGGHAAMAAVIVDQLSDVGSVNLLYVCDFPPSNTAGGDILMKRLLAAYSSNRLIVLAASHLTRVAFGRLNCRHVKFPRLVGGPRPFRLNTVVDWLLVPVLASLAGVLIIRYRVRAIITVAHGHFFIAAAMASFITRRPFVLVVHDDWVSSMKKNSRVLRYIASPIFRNIVRNAAHVYSVSPQMQQMLKTDYDIDSEIQFPATEPHCEHLPAQYSAGQHGNAAIVYSGIWSHAVEDTLGLMADIVTSGALEKHGLKNVEFHLYTNIGQRNLEWPWNHPSIRVHSWVSQPELQVILADADILFLPFSFSEAAKFSVETSFPSKTADYLASGKPILVVGPPYSTIVRYAEQNGFAAVVDEPDPEAIAVKIKEIIASALYRETLRAKSLAAFEKNHNIVRQRAAFCSMLSKISQES